MTVYFFIFIIFLVAGFTQGVTGFGFGLTGGLAVITAHALTGLTTGLVLHYFLLSAPVVIAGVYIGSLLYDRIDTGAYLKLLHYLLLAMGILMIWKGA